MALINGSNNADGIIGSGSADTIKGFGGNDIINALGGNDTIDAGTGNDTANGESGNDTIWGSSGFDMLSGGEGNDSLRGDADNDSLDGGNGADTLDGITSSSISGIDTMAGGAGNDLYRVGPPDVIIEAVGGGSDTVEAAASFTLSDTVEVERVVLIGSATSAVGNRFSNTLIGNGLANSLTGGGGDDTLDGGAGNDTMAGGVGNDLYIVDSPFDGVTEAAGSGSDTIETSIDFVLTNAQQVEAIVLTGASQTVSGNDFANTISGSFDGTIINGAGGNDSLVAGLFGGSILDGGTGNDTLQGATGSDTFFVDNPGDLVLDATGGGLDEIRSLGNHTLAGGQSIESLILLETLTAFQGGGNEFDNTIRGNALANGLDGGDGNDTLFGGNGVDTLFGDDGDDSLNGGLDSDSADGWVGNDTILGDAGNDVLSGSLGNDSLAGGADTNILSGGTGHDTLDGAGGESDMNGGLDNDLFLVDSAGDIVREGSAGGSDTLLASADFALTGSAMAGSEIERIELVGAARSLTANGVANTIIGTAFSDTLAGGGGDDTLLGGGGGDSLDGGDGNDSLDGQAGSDILAGGLGDDRFIVDSISDLVVEAAGAGTDRVFASVDFTIASTQSIERLELTGAALNGTGNDEANTIIGNAAANTLAGAAGDDTLQSGDGADSLNGGDGNDSLDGLSGADTMAGGLGNDSFVVDSIGDLVVETPGAGTDQVFASIDFTIANTQSIERLELTGGALNGGGNGAANTLQGNALDNRLLGDGGNDTLAGGLGSDSLGGGGGADRLFADAGLETMAGGAGADAFLFGSFGAPNGERDRVNDFAPGLDKIALDDAGFAGLAPGALPAARFVAQASNIATAPGGTPQVIYHTGTGDLWWDADGAGGAASIRFAFLVAIPTITASDFIVF